MHRDLQRTNAHGKMKF